MQYVPLDGFYGIQILQNSISAGALHRTSLESLGRYPQTLWSRGKIEMTDEIHNNNPFESQSYRQD